MDWLRRSLSQIGGDALNRFESGIYGHKDLLAHLIAYSLNLNGPVYSLHQLFDFSECNAYRLPQLVVWRM